MTEVKLSGSEAVKKNSKFLKGNVAEELADHSRADVTDETYEILKFHGTYFGHNRDTATERKKQKLDKEYEFMVRSRIPGGRMTAAQYAAMDEIAEKFANKTLRITSRQVFQFHVVLKHNLKAQIAAINRALLSTQSGCGDVVRNITASPAPINNIRYKRLREDVEKVAAFVRPKTSSYRELWLDEEADEIREKDVEPEIYEPLYGATYMPRKFKIGIILPEDNSVDVFTHDLGIVLVFEGDELKGYQILLGGGMGMKHEPGVAWTEKKTYPRLADAVAFVSANELIPAVEAVVKLQRDFGDRSDRQHARLKYVVQERGLEWTRSTLQEYFTKAGGGKLQAPLTNITYQIPTHMGWHDQEDGKLFLGIPVPSGRIVDYDTKNDQSGYTKEVTPKFAKAKYRSGLLAVIKEYGMNIVLTPTEEIILCDIDPKDKEAIEKKLRSFGILMANDLTQLELNLMACVALPTCAKALAESERVQFPIMENLNAVLKTHGLEQERITVRITGCPNGCVRPYVGDIGIVGRMPGHYVIFIGGDFEGTRLNRPVFDKVPQAEIGAALSPMFAEYAKEKKSGEGFGDFCHRVGVEALVSRAKQQLSGYKWAA